jgi:hypothetical protein
MAIAAGVRVRRIVPNPPRLATPGGLGTIRPTRPSAATL